MRSSTSAIWRVECLAGALHSQLWQCWPSGRLAATAAAHCFKVAAGTAARMDCGGGGFELGQCRRHQRSDGALVHDDQPVLVQPMPGSQQQPLAVGGVGHFVAQDAAPVPGAGARSSRQSPGPRRPAAGDRTGCGPGRTARAATPDRAWRCPASGPGDAARPPARRARCSTAARSCARSRCAAPGPACGGRPGAVRSAPARRG
jgi:hypothetical protein